MPKDHFCASDTIFSCLISLHRQDINCMLSIGVNIRGTRNFVIERQEPSPEHTGSSGNTLHKSGRSQYLAGTLPHKLYADGQNLN
jgi:hypothetical protein